MSILDPNELIQRLTLHARLLNPVPPSLPLVKSQTYLLALVSNQLSLSFSPRLQPARTRTIPTALPHQGYQRLLFRPALFFRYVRKVCRTVATSVVSERDPQAVRSERPVEWIFDRLREVC